MEVNKYLQKVAHQLVVSKVKHGLSKVDAADLEDAWIRSIGTERNYKASILKFLRWRKSLGLSIQGPFIPSEATEFLYEQADYLQQRQLDCCRQALQIVFQIDLPHVESTRITLLRSRAYDPIDLLKISRHQTDLNALATAICLCAGLRAHELLTLRRSDELSRSSHRQWREDLFAATDPHQLYSVVGKGGLVRHTALPLGLAEILYSRRLLTPRTVRDRDVNIVQYYDVGGGQAFCQSFGSASKRALGFSHGAHGLRHTYAQTRFLRMKQQNIPLQDILMILSQELGHFRPDITLVYLR